MTTETDALFDYERQLLSTLLQTGDPALLSQAQEEVDVGDFRDLQLAAIYAAMLQLDERGEKVSVLSVAEVLRSHGKLAEVGGAAALSQLVDTVAWVPVAETAARVRDVGARRRLYRVAGEVAELARGHELGLEELLDVAGEKFTSVLLSRERQGMRPASAVVEDALTQLDHARHNGGSLGLETGLPDVDRILVGLQGGDLIIIAARPGVGKTSLAMQIAEHAARQQKTVGVFSLEMPAVQLVQRLAAGRSGVSVERMRRGRLSDHDQERIFEAMEQVHQLSLYIDDAATTPAQMRARARRLKQQHPNLALIVVDYLQLASVGRKVESRQVEVAIVSRALKLLAKELDVPIIALSQLSREVEKRDGPPRMSDLRESGAIEQDADVIVFLHAEKRDDDVGERQELEPVELHVAKQRNGGLGVAPLLFRGSRTRFESRTSRDDSSPRAKLREQ